MHSQETKASSPFPNCLLGDLQRRGDFLIETPSGGHENNPAADNLEPSGTGGTHHPLQLRPLDIGETDNWRNS